MCIYTVYYHSVPITKEDLYARRIALFNQCESADFGRVAKCDKGGFSHGVLTG